MSSVPDIDGRRPGGQGRGEPRGRRHATGTATTRGNPAPFDLDDTDDPSPAGIDALNAEFARLWPGRRLRAPKQVGDDKIERNLCQFLMRHYFGD